MKFEDLFEQPSTPAPSNVHSLCHRRELSQFEQELREPLAPGNAYLALGWEKLVDDASLNPATGQYQYVITLATANSEFAAGLQEIGANFDSARGSWTLPLLSRPALKSLFAEKRDLLSNLAEDAMTAIAAKLPDLATAIGLPPDADAIELRAARVAHAVHRTEALLRLAGFLREYGLPGKVRDLASLDGRRSLHFAQHDDLGAKDQVLAYDYIKERIWWCAGTHPDSYASFLSVEGGRAVLTFMEQFHVSRAAYVEVPTEEVLQAWRRASAE